MENYKFNQKLKEGIIIERQHSFIMIVNLNGKEERCYCPCITSIGHIELKGRPCLLWDSNNPNRKTRYTVKAVSLNKPEDKNKSWIGIDQLESNKYIEHFFKQNAFKKMIDTKDLEILHEQKLGESRLDFKIGDIYVENKTILRLDMEIPEYIPLKKPYSLPKFNGKGRFDKHLNELYNSLESHERAIMLGTFLYDNKKNLKRDKSIGGYDEQFTKVESWQVNLEINEEEVKLISYYKV